MKRNLFFLIGMMLCVVTAYAQDKEELDPKDKVIEKLELRLEKLRIENEKLDSALQAERREGKAATYKKQIKQLKKDSLALSLQMETTVEELQKKHQEKMDVLVGQHTEDSLAMASLQEELYHMQEFRVMWLAQLAESVNEKWLEKPYVAIDVLALEKDYEQYDRYAPMDAKVAEARDKLKPFVDNVHLYWRGIEAVNSVYDTEKVTSLIEPMRVLRDGMPGGDNRDDVANLYWQLDNYAITIEIFQDVIRAVNEAVKGISGQAGAWPLVKAALEKQETESEYISAIKMIPWLAKQYDEYFKLLEKDSTRPNKVGEAIMRITLP